MVGISGAGKTTIARELARRHGVPHVEGDSIAHGPNWEFRSPKEIARRTAEATAGEGWVIDADYADAREVTWPRANAVVWLDYPRWVSTGRVIRRSVARAVTRRELWNGNRERWTGWHRASHPIRWSWQQHANRRAFLEERMADPRWAHLHWVRLRTPKQARDWLRVR